MPIIFDEYKHAEQMIYKGLLTSSHNKFELQLLANYYRAQGYGDKEIELELHSFSKKYFKNYNKIKFYKLIDEKVKKSYKNKVKIAVPISITKAELDVIEKEESYKCQKLMFVYLVLAKYYMGNNHTDKYYVGCKDNDIFALCDMYVRKSEKMDLMHYLTKKGYITPTLSLSSIVNYVNEDSEEVLKFIPDDDMIYYFEQYSGEIFINCEICGKLAKKTNNRIKYCKKCAKEIKNKNEIQNLENVCLR